MKLNWSDFEIILAVAHAGSLSGASKGLGVNTSTVSRRIRALEEALKTPIFKGARGALEPTPAGKVLLEGAEAMSASAEDTRKRLMDVDGDSSGPLRVTTAEPLVQYVLRPHLAEFMRMAPDIELILTVSDEIVDLDRGQADVAIRATAHPPNGLIGWKLSTIGFRVYGNRTYLRLRTQPDFVDRYIGWTEDKDHPDWVKQRYPKAHRAAQVNSLLTMVTTVKEGLGIAMLPCMVGDSDDQLLPIDNSPVIHPCDLWMLTHRDLRLVRRIKTFTQFIRTRMQNYRPLIEGNTGVPSHRTLDESYNSPSVA